MLYSDFSTFSRDQELLISAEHTFDYIEGLVIINRTDVLNSWRSSFTPQNPAQASKFISDGRTLYCLELTKNFNPDEVDTANKVRHVIMINLILPSQHVNQISLTAFSLRVKTTIKRNVGCSTPMAKPSHPQKQNKIFCSRSFRQYSERYEERPCAHLPS